MTRSSDGVGVAATAAYTATSTRSASLSHEGLRGVFAMTLPSSPRDLDQHRTADDGRTTRRRLAAAAALVLAVLAAVVWLALAVATFPRGLAGFALLALSLAAVWQGLIRRGVMRLLA